MTLTVWFIVPPQIKLIGSHGGNRKEIKELIDMSKKLKIRVWKKFKLEVKEALEGSFTKERSGRILLFVNRIFVYPHWNVYLAEMLGTAILLFLVTSSIIITRLIPDQSIRLILAALIGNAAIPLVAVSPLGKLSGAHMNPTITFSFWLQKKMHHKDFIWYMIFQLIGSVVGAGAANVLWTGKFWDKNAALILPGSGISIFEAFEFEIMFTFILICGLLIMLSHNRTSMLTPVAAWLIISLVIFLGASISGASMNPARSFGPAVVSHIWQDLWIYFVAPPIGALLATTAYNKKIFGTLELKAAKLFHTPSYSCIFLDCKKCIPPIGRQA
jgi:aquaporin Z